MLLSLSALLCDTDLVRDEGTTHTHAQRFVLLCTELLFYSLIRPPKLRLCAKDALPLMRCVEANAMLCMCERDCDCASPTAA